MTNKKLTSKEIIANMESKSINEIQFKSPDLKHWCEQLLNDGCIIFTSDKSERKTYFNYIKDGKIAYCQLGTFCDIEISSQYEPTKYFGSGSRYAVNPTDLNQFYEAFHYVENYPFKINPRLKQYDGLESFFEISTNRILDYYFITL